MDAENYGIVVPPFIKSFSFLCKEDITQWITDGYYEMDGETHKMKA